MEKSKSENKKKSSNKKISEYLEKRIMCLLNESEGVEDLERFTSKSNAKKIISKRNSLKNKKFEKLDEAILDSKILKNIEDIKIFKAKEYSKEKIKELGLVPKIIGDTSETIIITFNR